MTKAEFKALLAAASGWAVQCAQAMVTQPLPRSFRYHVQLNQSYDRHATDDEIFHPEDDGKAFAGLSEDEVVALLWREGRCPEWIDISAEAVGPTYTLLNLLCCGRYSDDPDKMYYAKRGQGPFGIKSPVLPVGWKEGVRFGLKAIEQ